MPLTIYTYKNSSNKPIISKSNHGVMTFRVVLLGTGGGRHTTMFQARSTGGYLIFSDTGRVHIDPGPGALTNMCQMPYDLRQTDAVVISHCHPDHYSDAPCVIEGMTYGGWVKRGAVYGTKSVMEGEGKLGPCLSPYHLTIPQETHLIKEGDRLEIAGIPTEITRADHSDPCNVGFRFDTGNGIFSYVSDTAYSDEIADQYRGSRVLLLPVTTPLDRRIKFHLCTEDAIKFINRVRPELTVFIHLGIAVLKVGPESQAELAEKETGCRVIAGRDLMQIDIGKEIEITDIEPHKPEWNDAWNLKESYP